MTKLIVAFRNFAKAHKKGMIMRSQSSLYVPDCVDAISILNAFTWFLDI